MAIKCPNKNLKDWNDLVNRLGEDQAYYVYMKNGEKVPYLQSRVQNRFVWDAENALGLVKWTRDNGINTKGYKGFDRFAAEKMIKRIRDEYVGDFEIRRVKPADKGEFGLQIVGMPLLKEDFETFMNEVNQDEKEALANYEAYREFEERQKEANEDILPLDTYEQRIMNLSSEESIDSPTKYKKESVNMEKVENLKSTLRRTMPYVEEIIEDRNMPLAGSIEAGGKTIRLNPDHMTEDTIGHEYGHLLIDLRGGLQDPFIKEGIEQLRGTDLENKIKDAYPDLEGSEKFDKELLAQAIGLKVVDVFDEMQDKTKFERWLLRFFRWLGARLGISKDNARELARQLVGDKAINPEDFKGSPADYIQEQRRKIDTKKRDTVVKAIQDYSNQFVLSDDGSHYTWNGDENMVFNRVSRVMNEYDYGITEEDENAVIKRAQRFGTTIHENAEAIGNNAKDIVESQTEFKMTPRAFRDLQGILDSIFGDDYTLLNEVTIGDPKSRMAGTLDVIAVDKNGKVHIFDYKTKEKFYKEGKKKGLYKGFEFYNKGYFDPKKKEQGKPQKEVNALQLSIYREMLRQTLGIRAEDMNIIQLVGDTSVRGDKELIKSIQLETRHSETGIVRLPVHTKASSIYRDQVRKVEDVKEVTGKDLEDVTDEELFEKQEELKNINLASTIRDEAQAIRDKAVRIITTRLRKDKQVGNTSNIEELTEILNKLVDEGVEDRLAVANFVANAVESINSIYADYQDMKAKEKAGDPDAFTIRRIYRWSEILNAYDVLDDVASLLLETGFSGMGIEKSQTYKYRTIINEAITRKNTVRDLYRTKGSELLTKELGRYSTRVVAETKDDVKRKWLEDNPSHGLSRDKLNAELDEVSSEYIKKNSKELIDRTKLMLRAEMQVASKGDINLIERWIDNVLDTNDMVMAAMVKKFVVADRMGRNEYLEMKNETVQILKELEKDQDYSMFRSPEKFYDFMLERDSDNNLTGHYVAKLSSSLFEANKTMLQETESYPEKERAKARAKWRKENMPTDKKRREKALREFTERLVDEGKMTEKQYNRYWTEQKKPFSRRAKLKNYLGFNTVEELHKWSRDNTYEFLDYDKIPEKWKNKQWDALSKILENSSDSRAKFYNHIVEKSKEADSVLPFEQRLFTRLPAILKDTAERALTGEKVTSLVKEGLRETFQKRADDIEKGTLLTDENDKPINYVPVHYTRNKNYDPKNQSYDLASIYAKFYKMASNYKYKVEILPEMELTKLILEHREYAQFDSAGKPIKQALDVLGDRQLTRKGQTSQLLAQFEDFTKSMLYGQGKENEGDWDLLGMRFDKAKTFDKLGSITSFNLMGLNIIQGFANVSMGEIQQATEAIAGEYFNIKDLHNATTTYLKELGEVLGDIGLRTPESKLGLLNEKFDILNEYEDGDYKKNKRFANLMQANALFFQAHAGEHFMQSRVMIAMLKKVKAYDANGELLGNMWDMYSSENGKLVLDKRVDRKKSNWRPEQEVLFGEKVKRLLSRLHGEYSELGKNAAQRWAAGRLAMMFRKFVGPGYKKRWEKYRFNEFLTEHTEGSYRSTLRYLNEVRKQLRALQLGAFSENWKTLLPREKANIRRAISEVAASVLMWGLMKMFLSLRGEADDEDEERFYATLSYLAARTKSELRFFWNPLEALTILRSPTASMSIIENLIRLIGQLIGGPFEVYEKGNWAGQPKVLKRTIALVPGVKQIYRMRDIGDLVDLFAR